MNRILINTATTILFLIGFSVLILQILSPWSVYISLGCFALGLGIKTIFSPNSDFAVNRKIKFIESLKPFKGCVKEYRQMGYGVLLMLTGLLILYLFKNHELILFALVACIALFAFGLYKATLYIKCVTEYNEKITKL